MTDPRPVSPIRADAADSLKRLAENKFGVPVSEITSVTGDASDRRYARLHHPGSAPPTSMGMIHASPFVEEELPLRLMSSRGLLADPDAEAPFPSAVGGPVTLIVGPEGGFLDSEVEALRSAGAEVFRLGVRVLTVETAVSVLLGRLAEL